MITTKKLIKISTSLGIVIDKPMVDKLKLKYGDMIQIDIKKVDK